MTDMLGYVFWHKARPRAARGSYERKLMDFQASLMTHAPEGLTEALSFRIQGWPWSRGRSNSFEDWYLVRDFETLGLVNDAAVVIPNKRPHDEIAVEAEAGAGGLYRRVRGSFPLREARVATWIRKPTGRTYGSFYEDLETRVSGLRTDLWRRQMVLSRAAEFCIHSERRLSLPAELRPNAVSLRLVGSHVRSPRALGDDL